MARDYTADAALRPQPARTGRDNWTTPSCLIAALMREVVPTLAVGPIWEPAAGDGTLANALRHHRSVIASDLEHDFLAGAPTAMGLAAIITNPPFNRHSAFIQRGLELLDAGITNSLVLLFRHDHLQSESRTPPRCRLAAVARAEAIVLCPWRPRWIPGTTMAPRWTFSWVVWRRDTVGPPALRYAPPPAKPAYPPTQQAQGALS